MPQALTNIEGIIAKSQALMVARGDLGVELELERVPFAQKLLIRHIWSTPCMSQIHPLLPRLDPHTSSLQAVCQASEGCGPFRSLALRCFADESSIRESAFA